MVRKGPKQPGRQWSLNICHTLTITFLQQWRRGAGKLQSSRIWGGRDNNPLCCLLQGGVTPPWASGSGAFPSSQNGLFHSEVVLFPRTHDLPGRQ